MSDVFSNPSYVSGQAQNLTGDIISPGGTLGYSRGSAANGSGVSEDLSGFSSNPNTLKIVINPDQNQIGNVGQTTSPIASGTTTGPTTAGSSSSGTASGTVGSSLSQTVNDYFVRAIIIILGFIFVAVGLSMFRGQGQSVIPAPIRRVAA